MNRNEMKNDLENDVRAIRKLQEFIDLLPDALFEIPGAIVEPSTGGQNGWVHVELPYDSRALDLLEAAFSQKEWTLGNLTVHATRGDCKLMSIYHQDFSGPHILIKFNPRLKGSHCELIQIGTREIPTYEIRCEEIPDLDIAEAQHINELEMWGPDGRPTGKWL